MSEIKKQVENLLKGSTQLGDIDIVPQFEGKIKNPKNRPILAVGIESVELTPAGLGGYFGENGEGMYNGSWAKIVLRLDCYTDSSQKRTEHLVFEQLAQLLIGSPLGITKVSAKPLAPAKGAFITQLSATAELQTVVNSKASYHYVSDFIVKHTKD